MLRDQNDTGNVAHVHNDTVRQGLHVVAVQ